ncbi:MAG: peptide-methionine (S)-S-oxide reductase MsrA [bacterium]|nr:peptide-methionine (S)-S-oxide reductase MsrA [bacterium]
MGKRFETVVFGGGCFWCVEAVVQRLKGVVSVKSGYMGGQKDRPSYEEVSSGSTGHVEVVQVEFDPNVISLDSLLSVFFSSHDPTSVNRQGNDVGQQYASAIFYTSKEQKQMIENFIASLEKDKVFKNPIVTTVKPAGKFYEAEAYHQNYYDNNPSKPYCQVVIEPKIVKLRQKYAHLLK